MGDSDTKLLAAPMTWTLLVWSACGAFGLLNAPSPFIRSQVAIPSVMAGATTPALSRHSRGTRMKRSTPRFTFDFKKFFYGPLFPNNPPIQKGSRVT